MVLTQTLISSFIMVILSNQNNAGFSLRPTNKITFTVNHTELHSMELKVGTHTSKANPILILLSVCVSAHVHPNLYLRLPTTAQSSRVRKQAKPQLLSVSRESGLC